MKNNVFVYIKGNKERSKEIIDYFQNLGAQNRWNYECDKEDYVYLINPHGDITAMELNDFIKDNYTEVVLPPLPESPREYPKHIYSPIKYYTSYE